MSESRRDYSGVKRVVVKVGSAVIAATGELDREAVDRLAEDVAGVVRGGRPVALVSSGAVACGFRGLGLSARKPPRTIMEKQASAAIGQPLLVGAWGEALGRRGVGVAQALLTSEDMDHRGRFLNARHTLETLLRKGIVPIVNENDTVSFDEIKLGDNDHLSAQVTNLIGAGLLVMLSSVDGLRENGGKGELVRVVRGKADAAGHVGRNKSAVGVGGMATKVDSALLATRFGAHAVIAPGSAEGVVGKILAGDPIGTWFPPPEAPPPPEGSPPPEGGYVGDESAAKKTARSRKGKLPGAGAGAGARKAWIGWSARARGAVIVDAGARKAIVERGASLLASGVRGVEGEFPMGAVVEVREEGERAFARGLASYAAAEIGKIKGRKTSEIAGILGYCYCEEVIHRNDLMVIE